MIKNRAKNCKFYEKYGMGTKIIPAKQVSQRLPITLSCKNIKCITKDFSQN